MRSEAEKGFDEREVLLAGFEDGGASAGGKREPLGAELPPANSQQEKGT